MPKYLSFILDIEDYELFDLSDKILNIFKEEILINEDNNLKYEYSFLSTICFKNENHFTIAFQKICQNLPDNSLKNNILYYYDGNENIGIIQEIKNIGELYTLKNSYPYLFINDKK